MHGLINYMYTYIYSKLVSRMAKFTFVVFQEAELGAGRCPGSQASGESVLPLQAEALHPAAAD